MLDYGFDFSQVAKEFSRLCNRDDGTPTTEFRIDAKELQIKWTEIEIKRQGHARKEAQPEEAKDAQEQIDTSSKPEEQPDDEVPPELEKYVPSNLIGYESDEANDLEALD